MSTPFSRSMRSLSADSSRRSMAGLFIAVTLLIAWAIWFCLAQVSLYEITTGAPGSGSGGPSYRGASGRRIVVTRLVLGQEVQAGDVLVELETNEQRLQD